MANPPCMTDDGNAATFLGTTLADGTTIAVCDECLVMFCAVTLQAMTGVDPAPFLAAISDDVAPPETPASGEGEAEAAQVAPIADPPAEAAASEPAPTPAAKGGGRGKAAAPDPPSGTDAATPET